MTAHDRMREPWWASGSAPEDGLDDAQDPFDAHRGARRADEEGDAGAAGEAGTLAADAIDLVGRFAAEVGRRIHARAAANASSADGAFTRPDRHAASTPDPDRATSGTEGPAAGTAGTEWQRLAEGVAPHADGEVCDACPVCLGLRALRQARPDVITHLSDAAHHVSLALRALADAQAGEDPGGLEKIDLDQ